MCTTQGTKVHEGRKITMALIPFSLRALRGPIDPSLGGTTYKAIQDHLKGGPQISQMTQIQEID